MRLDRHLCAAKAILLAVGLLACLAGCSGAAAPAQTGNGSSDKPPEVPSEFRSDSVVAPVELSSEYANLLEDPDLFDWLDSETVRNIPLEFRRAHVYEQFSRLGPRASKEDPSHRYFTIFTFADSSYDLDDRAETAARAQNIDILQRYYDPELRNYSYVFDCRAALRTGEIAWIAEQVLNSAPMLFQRVIVYQWSAPQV